MQLFLRFFFPTFGTKDRDDVESVEEQKHVHTTNGGVSSSDLTKHVSELEKHVHDQLGGHEDGTGEKVQKPFYRVPMRRHPWGCEQYELHASWGDLFLDLAYVGAAYRLGDVVKESFYSCAGDCYDYYDGGGSGGSGGSGGDTSGSSGGSDGSASDYGGGCRRLASDAAPPCCVGWEVGIAWTVAMFATVLRLWLSDLYHRARFATTDRVHKLLDIAGYMLVLLTANNVKAFHHKELRRTEDGSTNARFALFFVCLSSAIALWLLRYIRRSPCSSPHPHPHPRPHPRPRPRPHPHQVCRDRRVLSRPGVAPLRRGDARRRERRARVLGGRLPGRVAHEHAERRPRAAAQRGRGRGAAPHPGRGLARAARILARQADGALPRRMAAYISLYLPTSPHISLHLPTSPYISPHLPTSPYISSRSTARSPSP